MFSWIGLGSFIIVFVLLVNKEGFVLSLDINLFGVLNIKGQESEFFIIFFQKVFGLYLFVQSVIYEFVAVGFEEYFNVFFFVKERE